MQTNVGLGIIGPLGTHFSEIWIQFFIQKYAFENAVWKIQPFMTRPECVNSLRPRQNKRHFADDVFKCNFLKKDVWIPIEISLKFVPKGPIINIPALVQIMAWRRTGDEPLSETMMTQFNDAYMRYSCSPRSPKVVALFSATNFSSYIIEFFERHDTIKIK